MNASYGATRVPPLLLIHYLLGSITLEYSTVTTIELEGIGQQPTATFELKPQLEPTYAAALDWLAFSKEVLPNARPLTAEERSSINEFFWSHFK